MAIFLGVAAAAAGAVGYNFFQSHHQPQEITTSNVSINDVQSSYAVATINNIQNCATPAAGQNILEMNGNFNNLNNITQNLTDTQTLQCTFQAVNQQTVQQELTNDLVAQAITNATAPLDVSGSVLFGLLGGGISSGPLLNEANVNVSSIQQAVAYAVANSVQNCGGQGNTDPNTGITSFPGTNGPNGNVISITGNFNTVDNIEQNANIDSVFKCIYSVSTNQAITQNLNSAVQATAKAVTVSNFTALGWIVFLAVFFIVIGLVLLLGRWLWRAFSPSSDQQQQLPQLQGGNDEEE